MSAVPLAAAGMYPYFRSNVRRHVMDASARVTSKGQVTIPKAVRDALALETGDRVVFRVEQHRAIMARDPRLAGAGRHGGSARGQARRGLGRGALGGPESVGATGSMTTLVDTNVLVRHLTGDPPDLAARATAYLAGGGGADPAGPDSGRSRLCAGVLLRGSAEPGCRVGSIDSRFREHPDPGSRAAAESSRGVRGPSDRFQRRLPRGAS